MDQLNYQDKPDIITFIKPEPQDFKTSTVKSAAQEYTNINNGCVFRSNITSEVKPKLETEVELKSEEFIIKPETDQCRFINLPGGHEELPVKKDNINNTRPTEYRMNPEKKCRTFDNKHEGKKLDCREEISLKTLLDGFPETNTGFRVPPVPFNLNNTEKTPQSNDRWNQFVLDTNIRVLPRPTTNISNKRINIFKCSECNYRTTTTRNLSTHSFIHKTTAQRDNFKCYDCDYETHHKDNLRHHLVLRHRRPEDLFKCNQCVYETPDKSCFKRHVNRHKFLEDNAEFKCEACDFTSSTKYSLEMHVIREHKKPEEVNWLKCDECGYKTTFRHAIRKHVLRHKSTCEVDWFKCDNCDYKSFDKSLLIKHRRRHNQRILHKCTGCDFQTKSIQNLRTHLSWKHAKYEDREIVSSK